jgi:acyl-CoA synthetase (AMP-forming)/AMP-acid ligase II
MAHPQPEPESHKPIESVTGDGTAPQIDRVGHSPALEPIVRRDQFASDPPYGTIAELCAAAADRFGDREFLRFGDRSMTFVEVDAYASRLATVLAAHGIKKGDRVAIMIGNQIGWPLAWLAILKVGGISVPVNSRYQEADLRFVLNDSGASIVITAAEHRDLLRSVRETCPGVREIWTLDDVAEEIRSAEQAFPAPGTSSEDLAGLQYTSGTTGFPKACMLTHDYWIRIAWLVAGYAGLRADDVVLTAQPFAYMDPQGHAVTCLITGVPLVVLERFSASGFWRSVREHGVTFFSVLGAMPMLLLKQPPSESDRDNRVRLVICAGIPPELHCELEKRWGAPWREAFGMTESGIDLIVPAEAGETVGTGAIGRPVPTKRARIVGEDHTPLPAGEHGEIVIQGRPMMLGYWNQPDATAKTIRDGWLHTGDIGYVDPDGWFHIVGRLKDMIRRGGENISCAEVESVLGQHPAVLLAALVPVPDELFGEEPKAFIKLRQGASASTAMAEDIVGFGRERLARFKVPRFIEFVDDFPFTPSERVAKPVLLSAKADQRAGAYDAQEQVRGS